MSAKYLEKAQEKYGPIDQGLLDELETALASLPPPNPPPHFGDPDIDDQSDVTKTMILSRALRYLAKQLHIDFNHPDLIGRLQLGDPAFPTGGEGILEINMKSAMNMYQSLFHSMLNLANRATQTAVAAMLGQQRVFSEAFFQHEPTTVRQPIQQAEVQASSAAQSVLTAGGTPVEPTSATSGNRSALSDSRIGHRV